MGRAWSPEADEHCRHAPVIDYALKRLQRNPLLDTEKNQQGGEGEAFIVTLYGLAPPCQE